MAIEIKNTREVHNDGVKVLLFGKSGIGKSTQFGTLEGKTLILSAESGLLVLKDKDIDVVDITSIGDLAEVYTALVDGTLEYDNIGLDSLSEIGDILIQELENDDYYGDPTNAFPKWGEYSKRIIKIVRMFRDLKGFNVIFTALAESVEANGSIKYLPMIPAKKAQAKLVSLFDEVMYYDFDKDGNRVIHTSGSNMFEAKSRGGLESSYTINDEVNLGSLIAKIKA
jgi:phage nucleotide-binding protein